jgi:hypothetical protein
MRSIGIPSDNIVTARKVLYLPVSEFFHSGIICGTFNAAVPAVVAAKTTEIRSRFDRNFVFFL